MGFWIGLIIWVGIAVVLQVLHIRKHGQPYAPHSGEDDDPHAQDKSFLKATDHR
jgi:hypothetical protein